MRARTADFGDAAAVAIAGVCGAVDPTLRPGDLVVASELRDADGLVVECPRASALVPLLRERGLRVSYGPVLTTPQLLGPAERAAVDALAVDMESAWLAAAAAPRPVVVVRAVVDRAGRRLADPRTLVAGVRALLSLRRAAPALHIWASALEDHVELGQRAEEAR